MTEQTLFPYLRDILDQPAAVRDTLAGLREQHIPAELAARLASGDLRRVVLTGMGSSHIVFHPLHQALIAAGVDAHMVETSELLHALAGLLRADSLVVAASQSGQSAEVVSLLEMRQGRFPLLGLSNTPGSPLALRSDACVLTRAGDESTVSCKTYLAALMATAWLEPALLGHDPAVLLGELEQVEGAVAEYLSSWQAHVADLRVRLGGIRDVFYAGRGSSLASAGTGGLTTKESTHVHAEGMSSAAFRHGPLEMCGPETFVLVFLGGAETAGLNRRLYDDILSAGGKAGLASEDAPEAVFRLPRVPERLRPIVEILPVQMMTLALADLRGHVAGEFSHASKVTTIE